MHQDNSLSLPGSTEIISSDSESRSIEDDDDCVTDIISLDKYIDYKETEEFQFTRALGRYCFGCLNKDYLKIFPFNTYTHAYIVS